MLGVRVNVMLGVKVNVPYQGYCQVLGFSLALCFVLVLTLRFKVVCWGQGQVKGIMLG